MLSKCKKLYQHGLYGSVFIALHRLRQWYFAVTWRKKIKTYRPINVVLPRVKHLEFVQNLCKKKDHADCIIHADDSIAGYLSILGSHKKKYMVLPWHTDIRLAQQQSDVNIDFEQDRFFKDICIVAGYDQQLLTKDIKVPWELSRMQELPVLGHAYMRTKNERYAQKIIGGMLE